MFGLVIGIKGKSNYNLNHKPHKLAKNIDYIYQKTEIMKILAFILVSILTIVGATAQNNAMTSIEFDTKVIDYGTINKGSDGNRTFIFTNTGEAPFVVDNIFSSCTCDVISKPDAPIAPGEKGKIVVNYDTKKLGPIVKTLTIKGNNTGGIIPLKLKGVVVE